MENFMRYKKLIYKYLNNIFQAKEIKEVGDENWTYDIELIDWNNNKKTIEVKERNIFQDWILEKDDIIVEVIQNKELLEKEINKPGIFINYDKMRSALGWIYTEVADMLIYIKEIDTETRVGIELYDLDFPAFKSWLITTGMKNYNILYSGKTTGAFNIEIPTKKIPKNIIKTYKIVRDK